MHSDAAGNYSLGLGATCGSSWIATHWNVSFCQAVKPSIQYLELYAEVTGVLLWVHRFRNKRIILFCNNQGVVDMINSSSSTCRNCMVLIHILVLKSLVENVRIFARHISGKNNYFCDALSHLQMTRFWDLAHQHDKHFEQAPKHMPEEIFSMEKIWLH